jgi:uncharacterized repeat protein (TIGR01451 family)
MPIHPTKLEPRLQTSFFVFFLALAVTLMGYSLNVLAAPDLSIAKSHTGNFTLGINGTYALTVTNVGADPTTGTITVTDTLPTGLGFISGVGSGWSCSAVGQVVSCTNAGPLAASASSTITLTVSVNIAGNLTNTVTVTTAGDTNAANDTATDPTTINASAEPDLSISKSHSGNFTLGLNGTYTLTVTNVGAASTTGTITVTDTLPVGLTYVSASGTGWTCSPVNQTVTCTNASVLAPSSSSIITLTVAANVAGNVTNTATVSVSGDNNASNDTATDPTSIVTSAQPDLSVSKSHSGNFTLGLNGVYTITVTNVGATSTSSTITVTDTLPNGFGFVSGIGSGWTCNAVGQVVTCTNPGPLAPSGSSTITLTVSVNVAGTVTNTATVSTTGDANPANDSDNDPTTINGLAQPDLSISKSHSGNFTLGINGTYTITVTNVGSASTTSTITVTDTLPSGLGFISGIGSGWTCGAVNQVVTCTNPGPLAPSGSSTITLTVSVTIAGGITNTVTVSTNGDTNPANDADNDPTTVNASPQPDLAINKSHSGSFTLGSNGTYTLTVTNVGSASTTSTITVTDTLPSGLGFVSASGTGWTCTSLTQTVTCTNPGPLAPAGNSTITLTVSANSAGGLTNTATVSTSGDNNPGNDVDSDPTTVNASTQPDLSINKSHSGSFTLGSNGTYTLTVTNVGSASTSSTITVTDTLPSGLGFVSASGTGWSCSSVGQTVTCTNPGPLAASASSSITLTVSTSAAGSLTNTATVSTSGDTNPANDSDSDPTTVNAATQPDLALSKSHSGNFTLGINGTYTLTVTNVGSASTSGTITVTDTLPMGLGFVSGTGSGWTCSANGQIVTCTSASVLAPSASSTINLTVSVNIAGNLTNTATVSVSADTNPLNNSASDPTTINASTQPDLSITKSHTGNFTLGTNGVYTLTVTNIGSAGTIGTMTVTDTLPTGMEFVSGIGSGWTCNAVGQIVTCNNTGALAPSGFSTITLTVKTHIAGVLTNTATVSVAGDNNVSNNTAQDATTVNATPEPDLSISKTHSGSFTVGTNGMYTITVTNVGAAATIGTITVTDTLPTGLSYVSAVGSGWSCSAAGQIITCTTPGPLAPSGTLAINVTVNPSVADGLTNIAAVSTAGDNNVSNNIARDPTIVNASPEPDLQITKTHSGNFSLGSTGVYTLTLTNVGSAGTSGSITVTDTLPTGMEFVSATGAGWNCSANGQIVTCTTSNAIAPSASETLTLTVNLNVAGGLTNTATVSSSNDPNASNDIATDPTVISTVSTPDLAISKSHSGNFTLGTNGVYTLTVTNVGSASTTGTITVTDTLPTGLNYISAAGSGWTCNAVSKTVTCTNPGPLAPTGSSSITLTVSVSTSGNVTNVATVSTLGDSNASNDTSSDPTTVNASSQPDLSIAKTHSGNFTVGVPASYTLIITNVGTASTTSSITVTDSLPSGLSFSSASGTGWTCTAANQTVTCTRTTTLAPSASSTITLAVNVTTAGHWTNIATVTTSGDTNSANDSASDPTVVNAMPQPDLVISKSHIGNFTVGTNGVYTLTVTNAGAALTTNTITVMDTLPVGLNFLSASGSGWNCVLSGQVLTCTNPGPLAPSASTTISILVDVDLSGGLTNIATVSTPGDSNSANNYVTDPTIVMPADEVVISATLRADMLTPYIAYTAILTNMGTHDQSDNAGAEFVSPIPPGTVFVPEQSSASTGTLTYDSIANKVLWNGSIPAGQSVTISIVVNASAVLTADNRPLEARTAGIAFPIVWLGFVGLGSLGLCLGRRRKLAIVLILLLFIGLSGTGCTLLNLRHTIICNQGQVYYDSDANGTNDSIKLTDDPRMPQSGAPTCL